MSQNEIALLIPILGVALPGAAVIVWIVMHHRRKLQEIDARHKERLAAIDKGIVDLPPDPTPPPPAPTTTPNARYLLRGMIWLGVGLAFTLGMDGGFWNENGAWSPHSSPGWIAVAIGAAYLVFYFVEGRRPNPPAPPPTSSPPDQHPPQL